MTHSKTCATLALLVASSLPSWSGAGQICDTNDDGFVDITDIRAISLSRNQPATGSDDPMDWDQNGEINVLDSRGCTLACSLPRCAQQPVVNTDCVLGASKIGECTI